MFRDELEIPVVNDELLGFFKAMLLSRSKLESIQSRMARAQVEVGLETAGLAKLRNKGLIFEQLHSPADKLVFLCDELVTVQEEVRSLTRQVRDRLRAVERNIELANFAFYQSARMAAENGDATARAIYEDLRQSFPTPEFSIVKSTRTTQLPKSDDEVH